MSARTAHRLYATYEGDQQTLGDPVAVVEESLAIYNEALRGLSTEAVLGVAQAPVSGRGVRCSTRLVSVWNYCRPSTDCRTRRHGAGTGRGSDVRRDGDSARKVGRCQPELTKGRCSKWSGAEMASPRQPSVRRGGPRWRWLRRGRGRGSTSGSATPYGCFQGRTVRPDSTASPSRLSEAVPEQEDERDEHPGGRVGERGPG